MSDAMDDKTQDTLNRLVKAGLMETCEKVFGRSFALRATGEGDWLHLQVTEQDSGSENMTVHDLACLLQTDVKTIRRMTKARAQRQAQFPLPFFKINGKMLRFNRAKIQEWLQNIASVTPVFKPAKQRGRRKKQFVPHAVTGVRFLCRVQ